MPLSLRLLLILLLVGLLAFLVATELALLQLRPTRVEELMSTNPNAAATVKQLQRRLLGVLVTTQLGTSLILVALGWTTVALNPANSSAWLTPALFLLTVLLATLCGGLLPKAAVLHRPERAALALSPVLKIVIAALSPVVRLLERISLALLRLCRLPGDWAALAPPLSAGELETLIETDKVTGLQPDERLIMEGAFSLRDTLVREVMVPRSRMITLPVTATFHELTAAVQDTRHARFPVIGNSLDDVKGVLDLRRLAGPLARGQIHSNTVLRPYLTTLPRIAETASLAELLAVIRNRSPMLLVVDRHGGTEGLVTIADLTGEIVGEEEGGFGTEDTTVEALAPGCWRVAAELEIIELNRQLGIALPEADEHHTLAGFLLEQFQHIPATGEDLRWRGLHFVVQRMEGPRIIRVDLTVPPDLQNSVKS